MFTVVCKGQEYELRIEASFFDGYADTFDEDTGELRCGRSLNLFGVNYSPLVTEPLLTVSL